MNYYVEFQQLGVGRFFQSHLKLDFCREKHDLQDPLEASTPRGPVDSLKSSPVFQQQVLSSFLWQVLSVAWASYPLWWYTICVSENGWYTPQNGYFWSGNGDLAMDGTGYPIFWQIQICCDVSQPLLAARIPLALHAFRCWNVLHRGRFKEEMLDALPTSGYPVLISIVSHSRIW